MAGDSPAHESGARPHVTYGSYLALDELLSLQRPRSAEGGTEHPDELLFIVVHQTSELWFKVILHEIAGLESAMRAADAGLALWRATRVNSLTRIVSDQLSSLDTLPPQRFLQFRAYLGASSGAQSAQFRTIEQRSADLEGAFLGLVAANATTVEALYTGPGPGTLFFVAEALLAYDQQFARWRFQHVQLVERIIGPMTQGTGGSLGASHLMRTVGQRFFPALWDARTRLYRGGSAG
ncbi:tryptophan 2,3-dioxygenase [Gemmatimonadetes bacterium T265]|nr:tryptophan 2,3-dioxygenase [Gemmatimonadetes bacterium T265]